MTTVVNVSNISDLESAIARLPGLLAVDSVELRIGAGNYFLRSPILLKGGRGTKTLTVGGIPGQTAIFGSAIAPVNRGSKWAVKAPNNSFHQIYVNRSLRSRNISPDIVGQRKILADGTVTLRVPASVFTTADIDRRMFYRAQRYWREFIVPIEKIEAVSTGEWVITLDRTSALDARVGAVAINFNNPFQVEGRRSAAIVKQWSSDRAGNVEYLPNQKERDENAIVTIPQLLSLIEVDQDNVTIEGLTFAEGGVWERVNRRGWNALQAGSVYSYRSDSSPPPSSIVDPRIDHLEPPQGLIQIWDGDRISIRQNTILNSGTAGIVALQGSNLSIAENNVSFCGDSGITLSSADDFMENRRTPIDTSEVRSNSLTRCGMFYRGAPALQAYMIKNSFITRNLIGDCPYSGICIGWGWTLQNDPTLCSNNLIADNVIDRCMQFLIDGGAIYTLGNLFGSRIQRNAIFNVGTGRTESDGRPNQIGIYLDENTSGVLVEFNIVTVSDGWLNINQFNPRGIEWRSNTVPQNSRVWCVQVGGGYPAVIDARRYD